MRWGILLTILLLTVPAYAEDSGAIMASMPTPEAECRYLKQLLKEVDIATAMIRKNTQELKEGRSTPAEGYAIRRVSLEKFNNMTTALNVLKAKRGTDNPCPDATSKPPEAPQRSETAEETSATSAEPRSSPPQALSDRLIELREAYDKGLLRRKEYEQKRDEMLQE